MKKRAKKKRWESPKILQHSLNVDKIKMARTAVGDCDPFGCITPGPEICPM